MKFYHRRLHSASLVVVTLTACLALATGKECWVGEEGDSCLLYLGAEDATKCSKLQMAFGARAPAYTITSPSRPCLALVPQTCTSLELPKCHTFEATQAMEALGEPQQAEEAMLRRMPQQLAPAQAWQCYVSDANECLLDPVAITDGDHHTACDALHGDGQWDTCVCGADIEEAWQHCASPGGFCDRRIRGAEAVAKGSADLADVLDGAKGLYQKTCSSSGVRPAGKASMFQRLLSAHLPHKTDIYAIP